MKVDEIRIVILMLVIAGFARGEVSCFRTPAQAAVGVGEEQGGGYRLEFVRRDALSGRAWARVRSCTHPEWPGVVVRSSEQTHFDEPKAVVAVGHPDVIAGTRVRVICGDDVVRLEMRGIVQASARIGDRIAVRILAHVGEGEGHMELAVVRSAELLEVVREAR